MSKLILITIKELPDGVEKKMVLPQATYNTMMDLIDAFGFSLDIYDFNRNKKLKCKK